MATSAYDPLEAHPPIIVVGRSKKFLRAYPDVAAAVEKVQANFLDGGYKDIYGEFDRYRLVEEHGFFDAAGRELELIWESDHRLSTMAVRHNQGYVRGRFRAMLHEVRPDIDAALADDPYFDASPNEWPNQDLGFDELAKRLTDLLHYNGNPPDGIQNASGGWWHRVFGGH
jgi:hypothetical protein